MLLFFKEIKKNADAVTADLSGSEREVLIYLVERSSKSFLAHLSVNLNSRYNDEFLWSLVVFYFPLHCVMCPLFLSTLSAVNWGVIVNCGFGI